jgi:hypothetical protein
MRLHWCRYLPATCPHSDIAYQYAAPASKQTKDSPTLKSFDLVLLDERKLTTMRVQFGLLKAWVLKMSPRYGYAMQLVNPILIIVLVQVGVLGSRVISFYFLRTV